MSSAVALAALAGCTGVASASLAVSAYSTLLPILATGFGIHVLDALFVCFVVDCVNGALVCVRYRRRLTPRTIWPMVSGACVAVSAAVIVSTSFGISLLRSHEGKLKGGVALIDFFMGVGFLVRYFRHRNGSLGPDTQAMDLGSALLHHEDAVELVESESTRSLDGDEAHGADPNAQGYGSHLHHNADVVIEASEDDDDDDDDDGDDSNEHGAPLRVRESPPPAPRRQVVGGADRETSPGAEARESRESRERLTPEGRRRLSEDFAVDANMLGEDENFCGVLDETLVNEVSWTRSVLSKLRKTPMAVATDPKTCFTFMYVAFLGSLSGMIGFGGGNAFAIYYILVYKWSTITATCASSFISGFMTLGLIISFAANGVVHFEEIIHLIVIALPCDASAVLLTSHYAKNMSEQAICFLVSMLFFGIGLFVVVYSAINGASLDPVPP